MITRQSYESAGPRRARPIGAVIRGARVFTAAFAAMLALAALEPGLARADARTEYYTALAGETAPARMEALAGYLSRYDEGSWPEQARAAYLAIAASEEVAGRMAGAAAAPDQRATPPAAATKERVLREAQAFLDESPSDPERLLLASELNTRYGRAGGDAVALAERAMENLRAMNRPAEIEADEWPEVLAARIARAQHVAAIAEAARGEMLPAWDRMREAAAYLALDERFRAEYAWVAGSAGKAVSYPEDARRDHDRRAVLAATDPAERLRLADAFVRAYDPQKPHRDMRFVILKAALETGATDRALAAAEEIASRSETAPVFSALSFALADAGAGLDRAIAYGEKALALVTALARDPRTPAGDLPTLNRDLQLVHDALGLAHYKRGDDAAALDHLKQAAEADYPEVHGHYGLALERVGKTYDAAVHLVEARVGGVTDVEEAIERIRRRDLAARGLIDDRLGLAERDIRAAVRRSTDTNLVPDFDFAALGGGATTRDDLAGMPYIAAFWTSWCGPCDEAVGQLAALARDRASNGRGIRVVHMTADRDPWSARAFAERHALPAADVLFLSSDPESQEKLADGLSIAALPLFVLVDAEGRVAYRQDGYDGNAFAFDVMLAEWLEEAF